METNRNDVTVECTASPGGYKGDETMTMQECYDRLGGNFEQMTKRLPSVSIIKKFVARFPEDPTFTELCRAMESGEQKEAFRAAHTLKGVCTNLGFDRLLARRLS